MAVGDVVADDLVELRTGDQVVADGVVRSSEGLEIDESLLTGESDPIPKVAGAQVLSGSIVVAGLGRFQATAVGSEAYATRLTGEAKKFQVTASELVRGTNRLLKWISIMILVVGPLLIWSQFRSDAGDWRDAVTGTVAALIGMIPEGLVLLTSVAFMLAIVTLARKQTLVQELPAVEVLARVDVVCLDKTGTLTYGDIAFEAMELLAGADEGDVRRALALSRDRLRQPTRPRPRWPSLSAVAANPTEGGPGPAGSRSPPRASGRRSGRPDTGPGCSGPPRWCCRSPQPDLGPTRPR